MKAVTLSGAGGTEVLTLSDLPSPEPAAGEVVIDVVAAGVNRADLLQRQGHYPPPPGASEILGLEVSGVISAVGADVTEWSTGQECVALLAGGGYAEQVAVPVGQVLPVPAGVSLADAAALPEVAATVWSNLWGTVRLRRGELLLIHGGASGIGTMAIQLATAIGARVAVTAGSAEKLQACADLGAELTINYRTDTFEERVREHTDGRGADVILDVVGAKYLDRNIRALAPDGRLVVIGMQGGTTGELNLARLLATRGSVHATSLRARSVAEKSGIVAGLCEHVWPLIGSGRVRPVLDSRFPLADVARAHERLDSGEHIGKVLLDVR